MTFGFALAVVASSRMRRSRRIGGKRYLVMRGKATAKAQRRGDFEDAAGAPACPAVRRLTFVASRKRQRFRNDDRDPLASLGIFVANALRMFLQTHSDFLQAVASNVNPRYEGKHEGRWTFGNATNDLH
jgi:hypothetical protein